MSAIDRTGTVADGEGAGEADGATVGAAVGVDGDGVGVTPVVGCRENRPLAYATKPPRTRMATSPATTYRPVREPGATTSAPFHSRPDSWAIATSRAMTPAATSLTDVAATVGVPLPDVRVEETPPPRRIPRWIVPIVVALGAILGFALFAR